MIHKTSYKIPYVPKNLPLVLKIKNLGEKKLIIVVHSLKIKLLWENELFNSLLCYINIDTAIKGF